MSKYEKITAQKLQKSFKPKEVENLKNKLYKLEKSKMQYAKRMSDAQLNLNEATSRLNAQRKAIVAEKEKKAFKLFGRK
jgi:hypothetical protein